MVRERHTKKALISLGVVTKGYWNGFSENCRNNRKVPKVDGTKWDCKG